MLQNMKFEGLSDLVKQHERLRCTDFDISRHILYTGVEQI